MEGLLWLLCLRAAFEEFPCWIFPWAKQLVSHIIEWSNPRHMYVCIYIHTNPFYIHMFICASAILYLSIYLYAAGWSYRRFKAGS